MEPPILWDFPTMSRIMSKPVKCRKGSLDRYPVSSRLGPRFVVYMSRFVNAE